MRQEKNSQYIAAEYLIHLLKCTIHNTIPEEKPEECTWQEVYSLARLNSVESFSWQAAKALCKEIPEWQESSSETLLRTLHFDVERAGILQKFEENGISYLPLKGILISSYYPKPGLRSMADNDILYGILEKSPDGGYRVKGTTEKEQIKTTTEAMDIVGRLMKESGYTVKTLAINNVHDVFYKDPFFNFELHKQLFSKLTPFYSYYENSWKRAIRDSENSYAFHYSDEDEYIYFIAHGSKHLENSGCGIRFLLDEYYFLEKKAKVMDWDYINTELGKLGLSEFESKIKTMTQAVLSADNKIPEEFYDDVMYMLGSGTYGNLENRVQNELNKLSNKKPAKLRYWLSRIFMPYESVKLYFPVFAKYKILLPFLPIYRVSKALIRDGGKRIRAEIKAVRKN